MKSNVINVKIFIPNENILKRINNTDALKRLSKLKLKVGDNIEKVNHFQYSEQIRMFPIIGCKIEKI